MSRATPPRPAEGHEPAGRRSARLATTLFVLAAVFAIVSAVAGFVTDGPVLQGGALGVGLVLAGAGLVVWANRLLDAGPYEEPRTPLVPDEGEAAALSEDLDRGEALSRRVWLRRSAVVAGAAVVVGFAEPIRSLGPSPGRRPLTTAWADGVAVVTEDGARVLADAVPEDGLLTVFPEGHVGAADAQAVLVRVPAEELALPPGREGWAPRGLVAYSKVCSHAGCPVGLYQSESRQLLCPCHQSSFDVLRGAEPVSGPAAWPLPQLPLRIGDAGVLEAAGPFDAPVGPGWWRQ